MDDRTLIKKINEGDRSAIRLLVENNKNLVWHIIISMTGHNNDCEDLFQEVFLQVLKGIKRFRADARLSTWIGSVTHHVCVDYLRKKKRESEFRNPGEDQNLIPVVSQDLSWKQTESEDINRMVFSAIAKLPDTYRTVIVLYHLDERSYQEIAEITGLPDGTVKSYINRGRKMLRTMLLTLMPDLTEIMNEL
jgi:RNA polymerase sigma-70 factor (ECF subfamily)